MTTEDLIDRLATHRMIGKAPREELTWIATRGTFYQLQTGEIISRPEDVVNELVILLSGRVSHIRYFAGGQRRIAELRGGEIGGLLPYSRMRISGGDTVVDEPSEAVLLDRNDIPDLVRNCPVATEIMVHLMIDRARLFTSTELRNEKMISLGKLAAGLAHELNNPASAVVRNAKSLLDALRASRDAAHALGRANLTPSQLAEIEEVQKSCMSDTRRRSISGLALADLEEEIIEWLRAHGVNPELAEDLARTGIVKEALDRIGLRIQGAQLEAALRWFTADCATQSLSLDIELAATRIHSLVASVKGFTHMDNAPVEGPVDIPAGLSDTVALLDGKARAKSVTINLSLPPDLPQVHGLSAEINQVWMNLIDNAIDAAPVNGHVEISATHSGPAVVVQVVDDGPGIPADIKGNILDPFFTTKPGGEGTGLGLDIVRRVVEWHNGQVEAESTPGKTQFLVKLPCLGRDGELPHIIS